MDTAAPTEQHRFPCDLCGGDYRYDPQQGLLQCDHCGNTKEIPGGDPLLGRLKELDFQQALNNQLPQQEIAETRISKCPNCGAEIELSGETHATECPFCATPVVVDTGTHRQIKPRGVLPFALAEAQARGAMTDWLGKLWFAPNGLQDYARKGRRLDGIYVPYWTFDADTRSRYRGQRGTIYYDTRTVMRDGKRVQERVQKVRWRSVSGRVQRFFNDVLVLASHSLPKKYTDNLAPWDLTALTDYRPEYLAGFLAEGYQVPLDQGFVEARAYMDQVIEQDVRRDIGGDRQRVSDVDTVISDVTFKHVLLPVWMAAYKYRGKSYRFVVNGQTGRVQGERPYSAWKIAFAVLIALILGGIAAYVYMLSEGQI